jgi:uncharacterized membrane protein
MILLYCLEDKLFITSIMLLLNYTKITTHGVTIHSPAACEQQHASRCTQNAINCILALAASEFSCINA